MHLLSSTWFRLSLLFLLGLLLFLGLTPRHSNPSFAPPLAPLPQDPLIQVYFNHSQANAYTEPYRQQQRLGDDLEQVILAAIASAQSSIDLAVQEFNLPQVAKALQERQQAGIKVRIIVENTYRRPLSRLSRAEVAKLDDRQQQKYQDFGQWVDQNRDGQLSPTEIAERDALAMLENARLPLLDDTADGSKGSDLMHHKFLVIDRKVIITGSANFTFSELHGDLLNPATLGNANHLLRIESPAIARLFTQEFDLLWGDGPGRKPDGRFGLQKPYRSPQTIKLAAHSTITLQFSPTSTRLPWPQTVNGLIGRVLSQAKQSVNLALFVFSDQPLSNILETRHRDGVQVQALIEPQFIHRNYSEALDLLGVALPDQRCRYEAENAPWRSPLTTVGVPNLPRGDLLHHKVAIVDQRIVITGSHNWSEAANRGNDETLLVIDNPIVAAHFQREFDRLYTGATLGISPSLKQKLQDQQKRCG